MAIYNFITDRDLDVGMKEYFRDAITIGSENKHILKTTEGAAFSIIKSKLNNKYDLVKLFPSVKAWDPLKDYLLDEYCYKEDKFFKAKAASTSEDPTAAASAFWTEEDPRDQLLVVYAVAITLYFFVQSADQRKLSDKIENAYAHAMEWLDDVRDGKENPAWDQLATGGSNDIPHGSNEKLEHYL